MLYLSIKSLKYLSLEFVISFLQELEHSRCYPESCRWLPFSANGCASDCKLMKAAHKQVRGYSYQYAGISSLTISSCYRWERALPITVMGQFFCKGLHTSTHFAALSVKLMTTDILGKCSSYQSTAPTLNSSHASNSPMENIIVLIFFNVPIIFQFDFP